MPTSQPTTFGKYQILGRIAVGGMAELYKARLDGIGGFQRTFAIKRILPHLTERPEFVDMLVDEAKIAGLLSHANIVQILDLGQVDGAYYIAMEYVDGPDLGRINTLCRSKSITLPVPHAVFIAIEILKGLEYAHSRQVMRGGRAVPLNIVHRDISPANVLVSYQGEVKLTDFGIAKASVKAMQTVAGVVKGRFSYMSPEQAAGRDADQRSDLFSAGIVLYEMMCGVHPFRKDNEADTLAAVRSAQYRPPTEVNPDVPYPLEMIVDQALKVDPTERFHNATAMKEALDRFFHDSGFIFSHTTLAAFLKGLFPQKGNDPQPAGDQATVLRRPEPEQATMLRRSPPPRPDLEQETAAMRRSHRVEVERPTVVDQQSAPPGTQPQIQAAPAPASPPSEANTILRKVPNERPLPPEGPSTGSFGPLPGMGEDSTLIHSADVDDVSSWGDIETMIRPDPLRGGEIPGPSTLLDDLPSTHIRPPPPDRDRPTRLSEPPVVDLPQPDTIPSLGPATPHTTTRRRRGPDPIVRQYRRFQVLSVAVGIVVSVFMLFMGFFLGYAARTKTSPAPTEQVEVKRWPKAIFELPEGAQLRINDRIVPGKPPFEHDFEPEQATRVSVELDGYEPIEFELNMKHNEVRVVTFAVEDMKK